MNAIEAVYKLESLQKQRLALELAIKLLQDGGHSDDWYALSGLWRQINENCNELKRKLAEVQI